jgi:hypothetical protein
MKIFAILFSLISGIASASIQAGVYSGHDENGQACQFEIGKTWFENNLPHPLNERIPVTGLQLNKIVATTSALNLQHPAVVDLKNGTARFNHDVLQTVVPTKTGAISLTLLKEDAEGANGHKPVGIIYIDDNYRAPADSKKVTCNLQ